MDKMTLTNIRLAPHLEQGDILLVVTPAVWTAVPLLGVHSLQAACRREGLSAGILYSNIFYSAFLGADLQTAIAMDDYFLIKERLFARAAFGLPPMGRNFRLYLDEGESPPVPDHVWPSSSSAPQELVPGLLSQFIKQFRTVQWNRIEALTGEWVETMASQIAGLDYRIVGCSTAHGGLAPAIALLEAVKKANPAITTIIGGSQCEGEMAQGVRSLQSSVDYIFSGEGEISFPRLAKQILAGEGPGEKIIYGEPLEKMDDAPLPDYAGYLGQKALILSTSSGGSLSIPYETSRGCWHGRCTFCGQKGNRYAYRKKSGDLVVTQLKHLVQEHGTAGIYIPDNILPPVFFDTLFPRLAREIPSLQLTFQVKANLSFRQLQTLKESGAFLVQPGIESLSQPLLDLMDKNVTVEENINLLRFARSLDLDIKWNLLFGFPGDSDGHYEEMLRLFPLLRHLQPPHLMFPLKLCRFSRYQQEPAAFGIDDFRPASVHLDTLPSHARADQMAVYFTGDFSAGSYENPGSISALYSETSAWQGCWASSRLLPLLFPLPALHLSPRPAAPGNFVLKDTRGIPDTPRETVLNRETASFLLNSAPRDNSPEQARALDAKWAITWDSRFVPLVTAEPRLLQEFLHTSR